MTPQDITITYGPDGLVPAIVQDYHTRAVLMLAYMNRESLQKTLDTGLATFWSRSRKELWTKGETSGNLLHVAEIAYDCDADALLIQAIPDGPACHTGHTSCFYRTLYENPDLLTGNSDILTQIARTIRERQENPKPDSYTNYLLSEGIDKICKKVGEEATETVIAAKNANPGEIAAEAADLVYHLEVLLAERGMSLNDLYAVLQGRHGKKSEIKRLGKAKRGEI